MPALSRPGWSPKMILKVIATTGKWAYKNGYTYQNLAVNEPLNEDPEGWAVSIVSSTTTWLRIATVKVLRDAQKIAEAFHQLPAAKDEKWDKLPTWTKDWLRECEFEGRFVPPPNKVKVKGARL